MKLVSKKSDVPTTKHYAILAYRSRNIHHPAEGHGYPAYNEQLNITEHYVTTQKQDWEENIRVLEINKDNYVAFEVAKLARVELKVQVGIK
jgi:hypothetical protein